MSHEYIDLRRIAYDFAGEYGRAVFVPVCPTCGRFVKADASLKLANATIADAPNATCSRCGRVSMPFEGFF